MMRDVLLSLFVCFWLSIITVAQEPSRRTANAPDRANLNTDLAEVVVPISSRNVYPLVKLDLGGLHRQPSIGPGVARQSIYGSGFCLDPACSFIVTAYHVAVKTQKSKILKQKVVQRYFATGPNDKGATPIYIPNLGVLAFAKQRDLALLELEHPLSHHHGLGFYLDEMRVGQEVDIYGYPAPVHGQWRYLGKFPAKFKAPTTSGLLAFDYVNNQTQAAGSSGGIVVDRETQKIIGILCESTYTRAGAIPVQTLMDLVNKVQPFVAQKLFPRPGQIPPLSTDIYPKFIPPRAEDGVKRRPVESDEIRMLRNKAQYLADTIQDYIAVQSYAWGTGESEPDVKAAYEVRVTHGTQTFRAYPDGTREFPADGVPLPRRSAWVLPADEWSKLPKLVGTEMRLKIHQAPDNVVNNRRVQVFQYYAGVEDEVCEFEAVEDYVIFQRGSRVEVACYGEVWADEYMNILRISERLDLSDKLRSYKGWEDWSAVVTYGWLDGHNDSTARLAPLTIFTEARDKRHSYWCRSNFADYRVFDVRARLLTN